MQHRNMGFNSDCVKINCPLSVSSRSLGEAPTFCQSALSDRSGQQRYREAVDL